MNCPSTVYVMIKMTTSDVLADPDVLGWVCVLGNLELVKCSLERGNINPDANYYHMMTSYVMSIGMTDKYIEIVRLLLEDGRTDPNADESIALRTAVLYENMSMIKLLLDDERVDPSVKNNELILWAARGGNSRTTEYIPEDLGVITPFHVELAKLLLKDRRVDPSVRDDECMKCAMMLGSLEMVQILADDRDRF
jgi:hypothetical protein